MSGFELAEKAVRLRPKLRVILISGIASVGPDYPALLDTRSDSHSSRRQIDRRSLTTKPIVSWLALRSQDSYHARAP
jgi:hypothetical protein